MTLNLYFWYMVVSFTGIIVLSIIFSNMKRTSLNKMSKMMIAMSLGMTSSLCLGLYAGIMFSADLYLATLYGVVFGMLVGVLSAVLLGSLAMMDALFASLMGGMMGAMLGIMLEPIEAISLLQFFLVFALCCLFLYFVLDRKPYRNSNEKKGFWILRPLFAFIFVLGYILLGHTLANIEIKQHLQPMQDEQHHGH
jgi:hypothetical protein